jgi:hypothetical protein
MGPQFRYRRVLWHQPSSLRTVVLVLVREVEMVEGIHALATEAADRANSDNFISVVCVVG